MSYINYIEHPVYGRLWFNMWIRNWSTMFASRKANLEAGPLVEMVLWDFGVVSWGKSPEEAISRMYNVLDMYAAAQSDLPKQPKPKSWYRRWRLNRLFKKFDREGVTQRITGPFEL